jgi:hypothetical protein
MASYGALHNSSAKIIALHKAYGYWSRLLGAHPKIRRCANKIPKAIRFRGLSVSRAHREFQQTNVRFASLADIREHIGDVRFRPESRHTDSDNGSVAAVCFPHAPIGPTCGLKRVTSIPPILHDGFATRRGG